MADVDKRALIAELRAEIARSVATLTRAPPRRARPRPTRSPARRTTRTPAPSRRPTSPAPRPTGPGSSSAPPPRSPRSTSTPSAPATDSRLGAHRARPRRHVALVLPRAPGRGDARHRRGRRVQVITPQSALGRELLGKRADEVEITVQGRVRGYEIVRVA